MGMTNIALRHVNDPKLRDQLGKIEAERMTLERADFKLSHVLENVVNMVGHKAQVNGLKFCIDLLPGLASLPLEGALPASGPLSILLHSHRAEMACSKTYDSDEALQSFEELIRSKLGRRLTESTRRSSVRYFCSAAGRSQ